jgi:CubicO group peptidase (beta-lactamase class C family)
LLGFPIELDQTAAEQLHALAEAAASSGNIQNIVYGVVHNGQLMHHNSSATGPDPTAARPDHQSLFRIASMTKSFTAAAFLHARDAGSLSLHDPVSRYLLPVAGWKLPTTDSPKITLHHLLSMSSGLATDDPWADRHLDITPEAIAKIIGYGPRFATVPGEGFQYSNLGFGILGEAFRVATGTRIQQYITDQVLAPLNMSATVWTAEQAPKGTRIVTGNHFVDDTWIDEQDPPGDGALAPMGGLWSTLADLAKWVGFWTDAWPARDEDDPYPLSRASRREAQRVHTDVLIGGTAAGYGYGLRVANDARLGRVIDHAGGVPGFGSNMRWSTGHRLGVVALGNRRYADMTKLTREMLEVLAGSDLIETPTRECPTDLTNACISLVALLNNWDHGQAQELFADNIDLDEPLTRREQSAVAMSDKYGPLQVGSIVAKSATAATVTLKTDAQNLTLEVLLAPLARCQIQHYRVIEPPGD